MEKNKKKLYNSVALLDGNFLKQFEKTKWFKFPLENKSFLFYYSKIIKAHRVFMIICKNLNLQKKIKNIFKLNLFVGILAEKKINTKKHSFCEYYAANLTKLSQCSDSIFL